jgi:hypothetical protein
MRSVHDKEGSKGRKVKKRKKKGGKAPYGCVQVFFESQDAKITIY